LEEEVPDTGTPTRWACEEGHEWETSYSNIRQGTRCPVCAGVAPKTGRDYRALAEESGLLWLGPEVPNIHTSTGWECEEGHQWEASYNSIQQGSNCGKCAVDRLAQEPRKKPSDYHALAEESGFLWLGPPVPNNHTKTRWKCKESHAWEATYHSIQSGTGCPHCIDMVAGAPVSQVQRELCDILGGELNRQFGKYKVDVALDFGDLALAVEYDSWYWHAGREREDAQRDEKFISAGWRVLRIRSNSQLPTNEQLRAAIDRLLAGEDWVEIVLDDWGVGPTRFEID
jgi:very-short-patch-repair endonuclease